MIIKQILISSGFMLLSCSISGMEDAPQKQTISTTVKPQPAASSTKEKPVPQQPSITTPKDKETFRHVAATSIHAQHMYCD